MTSTQKWLLIGIVVVAIFFRFYQIAEMPGGLHPDEAANGLDINLMQQGHLQPFYERGNGREALFFYMLWGSITLFGKGTWQHTVVPATVGVIAIVGTFLVTRQALWMGSDALDEQNEQKKRRINNIALLASFFAAVGSWYVVLNRTAFRANLIPLFTTFTFYFLLKTARAKTLQAKLWFSALTGAFFALGFYSYIAYRMMIPIMTVLLLWPLLVHFQEVFKQNFKTYFKQALAFLAGFVVFISWIANYFITHPGSFVGRSGQVSVFNTQLNHGNLIATFLEVVQKSISAYFTHGDINWRQNISGFPFLSPIISPFFGVALIVVTFFGVRYLFTPRKRQRDWKYFLLALWFWGMLLPEVTTAEGIPHGLRSIGTIPIIYILSAIGVYEAASYLLRFHKNKVEPWLTEWKKKAAKRAFMLVLIAFVGALISQTYILYFVYAANTPENFYAFRSDLTVVSNYLKASCDKDHTYLVLDQYSVQTTDYLTSNDKGDFSDPCNVPYHQVDPENSWALNPLKPGDQIVFTQSTIFDTHRFKQFHPEAHLVLDARDKFGESVMAVYKAQ